MLLYANYYVKEGRAHWMEIYGKIFSNQLLEGWILKHVGAFSPKVLGES